MSVCACLPICICTECMDVYVIVAKQIIILLFTFHFPCSHSCLLLPSMSTASSSFCSSAMFGSLPSLSLVSLRYIFSIHFVIFRFHKIVLHLCLAHLCSSQNFHVAFIFRLRMLLCAHSSLSLPPTNFLCVCVRVRVYACHCMSTLPIKSYILATCHHVHTSNFTHDNEEYEFEHYMQSSN